MTVPQSTLRLGVGQFSHAGRQRSKNEDWLGRFQPEDAERLARKGSLFLVADGMGGHQSGELASRRAVDQIIRNYVDDPTAEVGTSLRQAIELANASLYTEGQRREEVAKGRGWGTTLVAAVVRHDELWIANVGDSRAYLLRGGRLRQLSRDHVLFPEGEGGAAAGSRKGKHIITRALGRKANVEVDMLLPLKLREGDRVVLCSDGLTTPLSDGQICDIAGRDSPQKAAEALVRAANERGGPDNVSVIVLGAYGRRSASVWDDFREIGQTLTSSEVWRKALGGVQQTLPGGDQGLQSPVFIAVIVLIILILIGLGFVLGLILL